MSDMYQLHIERAHRKDEILRLLMEKVTRPAMTMNGKPLATLEDVADVIAADELGFFRK